MSVSSAMTVAGLIEALKQYPLDAEIYVSTDCHGCFKPADQVRRDARGMVVIEETEEGSDARIAAEFSGSGAP